MWLSGCGGQTEPGGGGTSPDAGDANGGGLPREKLPECREGPLRGAEPDQPCPWIADGRCYETKLAACACVCPARDSVCISPLGGGEVDCI
jgi:hypothetical protein